MLSCLPYNIPSFPFIHSFTHPFVIPPCPTEPPSMTPLSPALPPLLPGVNMPPHQRQLSPPLPPPSPFPSHTRQAGNCQWINPHGNHLNRICRIAKTSSSHHPPTHPPLITFLTHPPSPFFQMLRVSCYGPGYEKSRAGQGRGGQGRAGYGRVGRKRSGVGTE